MVLGLIELVVGYALLYWGWHHFQGPRYSLFQLLGADQLFHPIGGWVAPPRAQICLPGDQGCDSSTTLPVGGKTNPAVATTAAPTGMTTLAPAFGQPAGPTPAGGQVSQWPQTGPGVTSWPSQTPSNP